MGKKLKIGLRIVLGLIILVAAYIFFTTYPIGFYDTSVGDGKLAQPAPLDPTSPWPKFRANTLQNGRISLVPKVNPDAKPWTFQTGKGIFSSPVVDSEGTVYIGSADQKFYAIDKTGKAKWVLQTGEIIDSSALLDNTGTVFFGSGDGKVYAVNRSNGEVKWQFQSLTTEEVQKEFSIKTYNVNWFEGNIGMLPDGTLLAPNDAYLVYAIDRDTGKRKTQFLANEMIWSLPSVNSATGKLFFGTTNLALKTTFAFDYKTSKEIWTSGGLGSIAATSLLTSEKENGAVVVGGFDGYVRALTQNGGKTLWELGVRDHIYSSPAQLSDGTIIQPSADGTVYAIDARNGKIKWAFDTLEPIRSSPAVDGNDTIYVGSGEGRLFAINKDGTLRWAYRCIEEDRNDLNASPALGNDGVYIAGESGGIFFVPYDYPLTEAGKIDTRCTQGPNEDLPKDGVFMIYTTKFGALLQNPPESIEANDPITFSLFVRKNGDTELSAIDRDSLKVTVSGNPSFSVSVAANKRFAMIVPKETWTGKEGATISVNLKGSYTSNQARFGLKFFLGNKGGEFDKTFTFKVPSRGDSAMPYAVPVKAGDASDVFEFSRLAAPNPTMLPSWNQIGFDSLHYLAGTVLGDKNKALLWVIGGKLENGKTVVDPSLQVRYPIELNYDGGLVTFSNYDGFKINFVGSWDMPFGSYRLAAKVDPISGQALSTVAFSAVAMCDDIEFYGPGLKLMGLSEFDTGKMSVYGGENLTLREKGFAAMPKDLGDLVFSSDKTSATVNLTKTGLKASDHVYSLLLLNADTLKALPLYYTKKTVVKANADGIVESVQVSFDEKQVKGRVKAYLLVDTYPAASAELSF